MNRYKTTDDDSVRLNKHGNRGLYLPDVNDSMFDNENNIYIYVVIDDNHYIYYDQSDKTFEIEEFSSNDGDMYIYASKIDQEYYTDAGLLQLRLVDDERATIIEKAINLLNEFSEGY